MSPMTILGTAGALIGSIVTGAGLGSFATSSPAGRWHGGGTIRSTMIITSNPDAAYAPAGSIQTAVSVSAERVVCKGCGPTLAERRMAVESAPFAQPGYDIGEHYSRDTHPVADTGPSVDAARPGPAPLASPTAAPMIDMQASGTPPP